MSVAPLALTIEDVAEVQAVSAAASDPRDILVAIGHLAVKSLAAKGFTMFRYVPGTGEVERIHSSDLVAYPIGGRKQVTAYPVNQAVLARGEIYVADGPDDVRGTYKDFEKIFALGVTSIMNVPVRFCGRNLGAMNVFGVAGQFDAAAKAKARLIAGLIAPALLGRRD